MTKLCLIFVTKTQIIVISRRSIYLKYVDTKKTTKYVKKKYPSKHYSLWPYEATVHNKNCIII